MLKLKAVYYTQVFDTKLMYKKIIKEEYET